MKKITKTANILDKICAVLFWLVAISGGLIAVCGVAIAAISGKNGIGARFDTSASVSFGSLKLKVIDEFIPDSYFSSSRFLFGLIAVVLDIVLLCWALKIVRRILGSMKDGQPFDGKVSKELRSLGLLSLIGGAVTEIFEAVASIVLLSGINLDKLFNKEVVSGIEITLDPDLSFIVIAAVFLLLSYVFRYGSELQQQADETL